MVIGPWLEDELKKRRQRQINAAVAKPAEQVRAEGRKARKEILAISQQWET